MLPHVTRLKRKALDLLFPQWCIGCGREGEFLCSTCLSQLKPITPPVCPGCGRPQPGGTLCYRCLDRQTVLEGIRSPYVFDGILRRAIHEFKYRNLRALAEPLARLLYEFYITGAVTGEVLVPVPLHRRRWRERGYNQSGLLAQELGRLAGLPVVEDCLVRQKQSIPQARAESAAERLDNVAGAFGCRDGRLADKRVILIDDVFTSGATLDACAGALIAAGAAAVWGLTLAAEL